MELYFKYDTLKCVVELFALFKNIEAKVFGKLDYSYLDHYLGARFSQRVRMQMLDYYKDYALSLNHESSHLCDAMVTRHLHRLFSELSKSQKVELYVALLVYVIDSEKFPGKGKVLVRLKRQLCLVRTIFKLDEDEMNSVAHFIRDDLSLERDSKRIIVVGNFTKVKLRSFQMYHKNDLKGKVVALYVPAMSSFLIKYNGNEELQLNKQIVFPERVYQFSLGGVVEGSQMAPLFFTDLHAAFQNKGGDRLELIVHKIEKTFAGTNLGLKELSFKVKSGQLMAIMGGSGTGKTTLFNVLSGVSLPNKGRVFLNGHNLHDNIRQLKKHLGYVSQDDLLIEELTVAQNLRYSAQLCRDDLSKVDVDYLVLSTLYDFGLVSIKDLKVGSPLDKVISGGQRKRLNIALELIRRPDVLFVDEPTSGLSSSDALLVIKLLKQIANMGNIVIINIHQPTSDLFVLFDKLLILDEKGYPAYYGNPFSASSYFKKHLEFVDLINDDSLKYGRCNPEQVINLLEYRKHAPGGELTGERVFKNTDWHKFFKEDADDQQVVEKAEMGQPLTSIPSKIKQFWVYFKRNVEIRKSDLQYLSMILLGAPVLAVMMAFFLKSTDVITHEYRFVDNDNLPAYLFISVVVALFLGLILSSGEIHRDLKVIKRESFLSLSAFSYLNSKVVYVAIVNAVQIMLFVWVGNSVLEIKGLYFQYVMILWLAAMSSSMLGLYISARFKSILSIYITIPFLLIPQILLAGAILDFDKIHHSLASEKYVPVYANVTISRWAYEALMVLQFTENEYDRGLSDMLIMQSKLSYYANFFVPKIETLLTGLNENRGGEVEEQIQELWDEMIVQFPAIANEVRSDKLASVGKTQMERVLSKVKKWLRLNMNHLYEKIEQERAERETKVVKSDFFNQKLAEFMLRSNDYVKYVYKEGKMLRKFQPGYHLSDNNYGRAHYYAPYKRLGEIKVKTWKFNMYVMLIFIVIIYIAVYGHLARKKF